MEYLIHPSKELQQLGIYPRHGAAIAILVLYFILLTPMAFCYFRTLQIIWTDPGYTPFGQGVEKDTAPGLEQFYTKDIFVCDPQGKPIWCDKCKNWKPDRTHHCSQIGRCVHRMDHFCPWVGGIVSENNLKFFIQFNSYGALYTGFVMIAMAVLLAERKRKVGLSRPLVVILHFLLPLESACSLWRYHPSSFILSLLQRMNYMQRTAQVSWQ